jgi:hypothetical protein
MVVIYNNQHINLAPFELIIGDITMPSNRILTADCY